MYKYLFCFLVFFNTTHAFGESIKFDRPPEINWTESNEITLPGLAKFNFKKNPEIKILTAIITVDMQKAKLSDDANLINEVSQGKILSDKILDYKNIEVQESKVTREANRIIVLKKENYQKNLSRYTRILKTYIYDHQYISVELVWANDLPLDLIKNANNDFSSMKIYE